MNQMLVEFFLHLDELNQLPWIFCPQRLKGCEVDSWLVAAEGWDPSCLWMDYRLGWLQNWGVGQGRAVLEMPVDVGWLLARLVGWLVGCLLACLLGWLVGWLVVFFSEPLDARLWKWRRPRCSYPRPFFDTHFEEILLDIFCWEELFWMISSGNQCRGFCQSAAFVGTYHVVNHIIMSGAGELPFRGLPKAVPISSVVRHRFQWKEAMIIHNLQLLWCSDLVSQWFFQWYLVNLPRPPVGIRYMMRDMPDGSMQPSILYNGFLGQVWVGHWWCFFFCAS